jgi:hypothetical protein
MTVGAQIGVSGSSGLRPAVAAALCFSSLLPAFAQYSTSTYLSPEDAAPIFAALEQPLPQIDDWPSWIAERDRETRARVADGDQASIVNWLLFGTSFTREPRIIDDLSESADITRVLTRRVDDLIRALDRRAGDERLEFARHVLGSGESARRRLVAALDRLSKEQDVLASRDRDARQLGDSRLEFAERSRIYRGRGLSTDTSLRSSFAVDEALRQIARDRRIGSAVRRVAIVGPGVDFADKQAGYDTYPPQTIQPFALQDSLLHLGLAARGALQLVTLDVNPRVNAHIAHAASRSQKGQPYAVRLLLPASTSWTPEFVQYWRSFGEHLGKTETAASPIAGSNVRTVYVSPVLASAVSAIDINVTTQHLVLESAALFDLVIATNVFVYYDHLQQGLAAAGIARMLRPDGILLSNNAIVEIPDLGLRSIGYSKTQYSDNPEDGDLVIWYQKRR